MYQEGGVVLESYLVVPGRGGSRIFSQGGPVGHSVIKAPQTS